MKDRRDSRVDLAATFSAMPGAERIEGVPDAWFWPLGPTSGHLAAITPDGEHAIKAFALRTYDESLGHAILRFAREHDAELTTASERPFSLAEGFFHEGYGFSLLVTVSPVIHRFKLDDAEVHEATREIFPAFRCEISGQETMEEARFRYADAPGIPATTWNREPHPYLRMRYQTDSREIPERGFTRADTLVQEFGRITDRENGFVEFENYERRVWRVTQDGREFLVSEMGGEEQRLDHDALVDFGTRVLYGPDLAAGTSVMLGS